MEEKLNFEKVWAMFQETREQMKEAREQDREQDREQMRVIREQMKEDREQMKEAREQDREQMRVIREQMKEAREQDREQMKEAREQDREQMREIREQMKEAHEQDREQMREIREQMKETDRKFQETDKQFKQMRVEMKELSLHLGGMGNSNGAFAENYFYNSLNESKKFGNEQFDHIDLNVKPSLSTDDLHDEYDIVLLNGKSVAIIEVKYRVKKEHIAKTINKAITFRQLFPAYKDFTFYLGLAGFSFDENVEQDALNAGLVVLKQVGDYLVIHDKRMKKF